MWHSLYRDRNVQPVSRGADVFTSLDKIDLTTSPLPWSLHAETIMFTSEVRLVLDCGSASVRLSPSVAWSANALMSVAHLSNQFSSVSCMMALS
jgi:hypothetical protein